MIRDTFSTPEDILIPSPDTPPGYPVDAILCALSRAEATLTLLTGQFNEDCDRYSDEVLSSVVWSVRGDLGLIRTMVEHGNRTGRDLHRGKETITGGQSDG